MSAITFEVLGRAQPAGSKRGFVNPRTGGVIITDANKASRPWKQEVASVARDAMEDRDLFTGPLVLNVVFTFTRPKGHYGTGRNHDVVKPSAPEYPAVKPDATKLLRGVEDAMTGIVWRDDCQVVRQYVHKQYGARDQVNVMVTAAA